MDFGEILDAIRPAAVAACASDLIEVAKLVAERPFVRSLIVFDYDERVDNERTDFATASDILDRGTGHAALISLKELEAQGHASSWRQKDQHPGGSSRVASIVHSSGSTGTPKAAMVPESAIRFFWTSIPEAAKPVVTLCLAPFSHLLGKGSMISALRQGGTVSFTLAPDMSTLFDDIRIARPTFLGLFPRIVELVYHHYLSAVDQASRTSGKTLQATGDQIATQMAAEYLGDRLCFVLSGGSRISASAREFFEGCFGVPLLDAYGNTEGGSVAIDGVVQRPPVLDYRLRDVPELGYFSTDKPYPRGEMCFKSAQTVLGYHNAPDQTASLFDEDGFICTGDIVEEMAPDRIRVIGRRNDVIKLSQGEFVAIGALAETFEAGSDLIHQAYVHGDSQQSYLLAVIVPDLAAAESRIPDVSDEAALNALIQGELLRVASQNGLRSFEIPRAIILETAPFSSENGLLSGLRKKIRPALISRYGSKLDAIYENVERTRQEGRRKLMDAGSGLSVVEKLAALLKMDLNIAALDLDSPANFHQLGGDSLGAVLLSLSIEDLFGVEFPADRLLSPTGNLRKWSQYIERAIGGQDSRPTAASIHGKGAKTIDCQDLDLSRFIDKAVLDAAPALAGPDSGAGSILLTGANGFLGRFVCLESLELAARTGGRVICLVRADNNDEARKRLDAVFSGPDPTLQSRYATLAARHLEVLAGDVGDVQLGLRQEDFHRLACEVDRVIHTAALVNHRFSYPDLFGANVLGTAEVLRFAMTNRRKAIDFVSTIAVLSLLDPDQPADEDTPLLDSIELVDDYAAGYTASKWASEHLLMQAGAYGVPVNILRGNMMLPHRVYSGQINTADMFSRLLFSIIRTGMAPASFYPLLENGSRSKAHYDGLPVDVVASVIVAASLPDLSGRVYNITNYHVDDGCSLDSFVDWIGERGYPITRSNNYQDWFSGFRAALSRLSEDEKVHSALEIIDAFAYPLPTDGPEIASARFAQLFRTVAGGKDIPHLSRDYAAKCLSDLHVTGLVDPPNEPQTRNPS